MLSSQFISFFSSFSSKYYFGLDRICSFNYLSSVRQPSIGLSRVFMLLTTYLYRRIIIVIIFSVKYFARFSYFDKNYLFVAPDNEALPFAGWLEIFITMKQVLAFYLVERKIPNMN